MIPNIVITTMLVVTGMLLISEVHAFWHDRTTIGNFSVTLAVVIVLLYFLTGLWQLWTR